MDLNVNSCIQLKNKTKVYLHLLEIADLQNLPKCKTIARWLQYTKTSAQNKCNLFLNYVDELTWILSECDLLELKRVTFFLNVKDSASVVEILLLKKILSIFSIEVQIKYKENV
ncbi:hypothetical protein BpHYR1_035592 [Brachionus plicatilis]|uniref:Uncharacterized protein n=1 Tax=Brachionus plicatilis TaxID=10195 RepID=A0A3M7R9S6_BRAPC|nr:hypothetical protein BpHYR1_035592 [Brachionus plicatilis]